MRPFFNRSPLTRDLAMRFASRFTFLLFATWLVLVTSSAVASELDARKLLPSSTVIYLEGKSLESVLEHPLTKAIQSTKAFKKIWRSPDVMKLRGGLTLFEFAVGDKVESLAKKLTANGFHFAFDKNTEGAVILASTESQEWVEEYLQKLAKIVRADAKSKGQPDPIQEAEYRGIRGYEFQKIVVENIGSILIVTNKAELGKSIIDRHLDSTNDHLLDRPFFQNAWKSSSQPEHIDTQNRFAKVFVDLETLRQAGVAKDLLKGKAKDFAAELILGGVLASLEKTSFAIGELTLGEGKLRLQFQVPHQKEWTEESREFFVGPQGQGYATSLASGSGMLASICAYRDLSQLWLRAGDLFDERVNDQLSQAENTLTTLFSGKDFGTDILGAIEPQIQLIAAGQSFEPGYVPAIQLPSVGLVAKLKDPSMRKEFKRIFQSFIGFLNVTGAMGGNPQLDLESETIGARQIYSATYLKESDKKYENGLPVQFNFSPTLAFDGDIIFIASTNSLAKQLTSQTARVMDDDALARNNTTMDIQFAALKNALDLNRVQLISQNMLEKGHSKLEAEKEIDTLIGLISMLRSGRAVLRFNDQVQLQLDLEINTDQ